VEWSLARGEQNHRVEGEVVKSEERSRKRAERNKAQNPSEYYTLIVSITVLGLCVIISTAVFRAPVSQFVVAVERTIASVGGDDPRR
jgi:hypothetical protein